MPTTDSGVNSVTNKCVGNIRKKIAVIVAICCEECLVVHGQAISGRDATSICGFC
jgi:hypothetical protein